MNDPLPISPAQWVALHARHCGSAPCFVDGVSGRVWSFGEVSDRVHRLARALRELGIGRHHRIGLLDTDSVDYMVVVLASLVLGSTYVPLNYRLATGELATIVRHARLDALVVGDQYLEVLDPLRPLVPSERLFWFGRGDPSSGVRVTSLVASQADGSPLAPAAEWEDIVGLMFTSGTTGRPKGVMQSLRMVERVTTSGILDFRLQRDEFRYSASPMFHVAGLGCVYYGLARGFASLILPQFDVERLLEWMRNGLTGFLAMPTMLNSLLRHPDVRSATYPALRSIAYGGAPMTVPMLTELIDVFDCGFFNSFGAGTEAGGQTMLYPEDHERALRGAPHLLGSIGRPMFGVELRITDEQLTELPRGEIGEIVTRSNTVMSGYVDDPEATATSIVDGWFRAGDMAWMDDEGYLYLATRKSDMIIRGGENVYPLEIETVLAEHPGVAEAAVFGVPDEHWGERVAAAVVAVPGASFDAQDLRRHCRAALAAYKVPEIVVSVSDLPRNANGKVQKHRLAELLSDTTGGTA